MAKRQKVVAVRLTESEAASLEVMRGDLSPSQYLRKVLAQDRRRFAAAQQADQSV